MGRILGFTFVFLSLLAIGFLYGRAPSCQSRTGVKSELFNDISAMPKSRLTLHEKWDPAGKNKFYGYKYFDSDDWVIQPKYTYARGFSEGYAAVLVSGKHFGPDEKWGFIDETGKSVFEGKLFDGAESFHEGLAAVLVDGKVGFINFTGALVISPQFSDLSYNVFYDGLAIVQLDSGKTGVINKQGIFVIKPAFDSIEQFSEGLAAVKIHGQYGYVNLNEQVVIKPRFENAGPFSEGLAAVEIAEKWGYINRKGEIVIQPRFKQAGKFKNGSAWVLLQGEWKIDLLENGVEGAIDTSGKELCRWNYRYD